MRVTMQTGAEDGKFLLQFGSNAHLLDRRHATLLSEMLKVSLKQPGLIK